jgi:tetratricopeptide (TPR) repeat protein
MHILAVSYAEAGRQEERLKLQAEVLALDRKVLGPEHPETLIAMNDLAIAYRDTGRQEEALKLQEELLALSRKVLGPEDPGTLIALHHHADALRALNRLGEAEAEARRAVDLYRQHPDWPPDESAHAASILSAILTAQGRTDESLKLEEETLALGRKVNGPEHPETLKVMGNLALIYDRVGRRDEALKLREEVLALDRKVLGPEHPQTLGAMHVLAVAYAEAGRQEEALKLQEELLALSRKVLGPEHPGTAVALHHHADALRALNRLDEAEAEARQAKDLYRKHPDWPPDEAAHTASILSAILTAQGRIDESLTAQRELLALQRRTLHSGSAQLGNALASFSNALLTRHTLESAREAEPLLRECLEIRVKTIPDDWRVPNTRSMLGGAILACAELDPALNSAARADRLREAEPLLLDGYAGLKDNASVPTPAQTGGFDRRREALERVVRLYEVWDKAEPGRGHDAKAAEWRKRLDADPGPAAVSEKKP